MILAVDFDGTISFGEWPECGQPNRPLIDFLKMRKEMGDKLILWTCRQGKPLEDAIDYCYYQGLIFDAINDNVPETIEEYGCNSRKITCDYYIDDRAVSVNEFTDFPGMFCKAVAKQCILAGGPYQGQNQ